MDDIDTSILARLRRDARTSYAALGREVGLSTAAAKRRVERLESDGIIEGYGVRVGHGKLGLGLEAFIEVRFSGSTAIEDLWGPLQGIAEVEAVYATAGDLDILVHVRARGIDHLADVVAAMRRKQEIVGTRTLIVLASRSRDEW